MNSSDLARHAVVIRPGARVKAVFQEPHWPYPATIESRACASSDGRRLMLGGQILYRQEDGVPGESLFAILEHEPIEILTVEELEALPVGGVLAAAWTGHIYAVCPSADGVRLSTLTDYGFVVASPCWAETVADLGPLFRYRVEGADQ